MSARLDLVAVVLEPAVPVLRHVRDVVPQHVEHLLDGLLVDDASQSCERGVLGRDHHGHVVVQDLDREVLAALPEHLLDLLRLHLTRAMVRVDDVVAQFEFDCLDRDGDLDDRVVAVAILVGVHVEVVVRIEVGVDVGVEIDQALRVGIQVVFQKALFDCSGNGVLLGSLGRPTFVAGGLWSRLQVTVHEVDLLNRKALADVLRTDLPHAVDRLELGIARGQQLVETAEAAHDTRDDQLGSRGMRPRMRYPLGATG